MVDNFIFEQLLNVAWYVWFCNVVNGNLGNVVILEHHWNVCKKYHQTPLSVVKLIVGVDVRLVHQ